MNGKQTAGPARSPYITREGWETLNQEQDALWKRRRKVVTHLAAAAAEGDRSENAEYIYRKKQLREIDRRIRYLQKRLPELQVVHAFPENAERVFFGAWITLRDSGGQEVTYRIVGADESDHRRNWISIDSPMARALLRHALDETVLVHTPSGAAEWEIQAIRYTEHE
ncbi:MAG: transcription elongation factor GreB [Gammaproteobacteria bacterium]|nr:transcription elongation factor GreB [Gammaproteobacteria bacterium]